MTSDIINVSESYRSGFSLKIRKVNGKVVGTQLELSNHNAKLEDTLSSLNDVIKKLGLEGEISLKQEYVRVPVIPPSKPQEYVYYCLKCNKSIPAYKDMVERQRLFCPNCSSWEWHEKLSR